MFRNGEATVTDGPFAETKEVLGGYFIADCTDLDEAIEIASRIPVAENGSVSCRSSNSDLRRDGLPRGRARPSRS